MVLRTAAAMFGTSILMVTSTTTTTILRIRTGSVLVSIVLMLDKVIIAEPVIMKSMPGTRSLSPDHINYGEQLRLYMQT